MYSGRLDGCTVRLPKAAVEGISLAIPNGECFGLLGTNGESARIWTEATLGLPPHLVLCSCSLDPISVPSLPPSLPLSLLIPGAGKTTTFSIITGDIPMTEGTASISGFDIRTHLRDVQQRIGYCPQFDALINRLTGRELLTMYGRLRGIPEHKLKNSAEAMIQRLDLSKYGDKQCGTYRLVLSQ